MKKTIQCLCTVFFCMIFLYGCGRDTKGISYVEQEVTDGCLYIDSENIKTASPTSLAKTFSVPIKITSDDAELEFYFCAENGVFLVNEDASGERQTIDSETAFHGGDTLLWVESGLADEYYTTFRVGAACVGVRMEKAGNIVGYAVIKLERSASGELAGEISRYIEFPQVDGAYQAVTAEYVDGQFEKAKLELAESGSTGGSSVNGAVDAESKTGKTSGKTNESSIVQSEVSGDILVTEYWRGNDQLSNGEKARELICLNGDEDTEYWFTVDKGALKADGEFAGENDGDGHSAPLILSGNATLRIDRTVYQGTKLLKMWKGGSTYINVVKYKGGNIVGYGVVYLYFPRPEDKGLTCRAELVREVEFPQVNGRYQKISEDYVWTEIEKTKADHAESIKAPFVEEVTDSNIYVTPSSSQVGLDGLWYIYFDIGEDDDELEYYFRADNGYFKTKVPGSFIEYYSVRPQDAVHGGIELIWVVRGYLGGYRMDFDERVVYIDARIEKEGNIVGYTVIKAEMDETKKIRTIDVIRDIAFPQVDGAYQTVTVEYVDSEVERAIWEWECVENGTDWAAN